MKSVLVIIFVALSGLTLLLFGALDTAKKEVARLNGNQRSLLADIESYRTKDSLSVAKVERLLLTNREFEKYCADLKLQLGELGIKVKRLQSVTEVGINASYSIDVQLKDSTVVRDSTVVMQCIELHTPYIDVSGCIEQDRFVGDIASRDTLDLAVHREPKRFWFIRYGTKGIWLTALSKNPHSKIEYARYIEMK